MTTAVRAAPQRRFRQHVEINHRQPEPALCGALAASDSVLDLPIAGRWFGANQGRFRGAMLRGGRACRLPPPRPVTVSEQTHHTHLRAWRGLRARYACSPPSEAPVCLCVCLLPNVTARERWSAIPQPCSPVADEFTGTAQASLGGIATASMWRRGGVGWRSQRYPSLRHSTESTALTRQINVVHYGE